MHTLVRTELHVHYTRILPQQVSRIKQENLEERLHLRVFRFNNDANARVPAVGDPVLGHGADVPWWKRAALREICAGVMSNPGAAFSTLRVPVMPSEPEVLGFSYIQELRQSQLPLIPEAPLGDVGEDSPAQAEPAVVPSGKGKRAAQRSATSMPKRPRKNRAVDPAAAKFKPPSSAEEDALYTEYLASSQAFGKSGRDAHQEACATYNRDRLRSASSGTGDPTFPSHPTTVAIATEFMRNKAKTTKKVQDLAAAAAKTAAAAGPRPAASAVGLRGGAERTNKRSRDSAQLPSSLPVQCPREARDDPSLEQDPDSAKEPKRVKNSQLELNQAALRNLRLKSEATQHVLDGNAVTTRNVGARVR
jgi:hypothetical protein